MRPSQSLVRRFRSRALAAAALLVVTLGLAWACADVVAPRVPVAAAPRMSLTDAYRSGRPGLFRSGVAADRCMDAAYFRRDEGTPVVISTCTGTENQLFSWGADGLIRVYSPNPMCVTVQGAGAHLDPVVLAPCDGRPGQRWAPTAGGTGVQLAGRDMCLDVPYSNATPATQLVLGGYCHSGSNQVWDVPSVTRVRTTLSDAYGSAEPVRYQNGVAPDRCMDAAYAWRHEGTPVVISNCVGTENQLFAWRGDGTLQVYGATPMCVTVRGTGVHLDPVVLAPCDGRAGERWVPSPDGNLIQLAGKSVCLDVPYTDPTPATQLIVGTCHGGRNQVWSVPGRTCGVSFTAVVTSEDDLLAAYGIPATTDTVGVCETWTGSDYVMRETLVGSAPNAFLSPDTARTVVYSGGQVTAIAADGGPVHGAVPVGATAFDFMEVDEATRQASYDNPYYAVYAPDGPGCGGQIRCSVGAAAGATTLSGASQAAADTARADGKFAKHGIKRRGTRALVEDAEEVGRSPDGHRRFRKRRGDTEVTLTLDKDTELLVGEETRAPGGTTKATHTWKQDKRNGYAREHSVVESTEEVGGRSVRSRTTTTLIDVALDTDDSSPAARLRAPR